ncbi:MAG: HAMP domain-containing histidine kinase [Bacteroidetes bacterium]|nr:MAG: HAMP domain-containing histidine kinase [Bacteroidota bacterium]
MINQKTMNKSFFSNLYWKIAATLLLLLVVIGCAYIFITADTVQRYFQEKNQRLNAELAAHVVQEVKPTYLHGKVDEASMDKIMHSMMAINPSIEVYLLDVDGNILNYVAPYKKVKLDKVGLAPIHDFIETKGQQFIKGDDPRNPGVQKEFSAAPINEEDQLIGYVYVVLASEEYDIAARDLIGNYIMRLGGKTMIITLLTALMLGLLIFWLITRYLNQIIKSVKRFKEGHLKERIPVKSSGELKTLAVTFNEMAEEILISMEKIKTTENLRRELVANVSHDLRTPLSVIHGYVETMLMKAETITSEQQKQYLETILKSTERLKKLVGDLFELSKLEAHEITPKKEPFFITELVQDVSQKHKLIAEEKNVTIVPVVDNNVPMVHADISLIERVLQNLMDNAIKFSADGGVITIETHNHGNKVEIKVTDTGRGIPEEDIPLVFDRYFNLSKSASGGLKDQDLVAKSSVGLGLAIVKKILEIHDATIHLTSKLNKGSAFSFRLPVYQGY